MRAVINPLDDPGVRRLLAELKLELLLWQLRRKYSPNQPRVPAGNPDGGQWTKEGDDAGRRLVLSDANPDELVAGAQYAELKRPGIGHNNPPPDVPVRRPPTAKERHKIAREVARWPGSPEQFFRMGQWLRELAPSIRAYRDPPKTLEELQNAVTDTSTPGYDDHHNVERVARREEDRGFPAEWIDRSENIVRIPRFKHWEINSWYQRPNEQFNGLTPREYLRGKDWAERYQVGLDALIEHGVLKP